MWVKAENVEGRHTLRWEWITPDGQLYLKTEDYDISKEGERHDRVTGAHRIGIHSEKAAKLTGEWKVKVYIDNYFKSSESFTVSAEGICGDIDGCIKNGPETPVKKDSKKWGVVIGIENYRNTIPANYAKKDAEVVKEYMTKFMGIPNDNVYLRLNNAATKASLDDLFSRELQKKVRSGDTLYLYYAGHGVPDPKAEAIEKPPYLLLHDSNPENIGNTALSLDKLYADLGSLNAKEVYVILDACFTGVVGRSETLQSIIGGRPGTIIVKDPVLASKKEMLVLASSEKNQMSNSYKEEEHGLFTYFFLKGMLGEADINRDGVIRAEELYDYVYANVESKTRQSRPQRPVMKKSLAMEGIDPLIVRVK
ncbi:MAG: caspase family protein [Nitrospirae bacterium]|nr:caspase family protein [Nitrospirota bacterium]